jgi:hypothetical protein
MHPLIVALLIMSGTALAQTTASTELQQAAAPGTLDQRIQAEIAKFK